MRIGLESLIAGVVDDDDVNGLMILSCFGTNGNVSILFTEVIGCANVGVMKRIELVVDVGLVIDKRMTRGDISCVV